MQECNYIFHVRKKPGEEASVVINCSWPTGHCSRITVHEDDWPHFIDGFLQAIRDKADLAHLLPPSATPR